MSEGQDDGGVKVTLLASRERPEVIGAEIRRLIEQRGGVPAFSDRRLGELSLIHEVREMKYRIDSNEALRKCFDRATGRTPAEGGGDE